MRNLIDEDHKNVIPILVWIIIWKKISSDDDDSRVKIETGNGAGNQLVTLLKQFSQQWIILQGNIKIYLHSLNTFLQKQMQLYIWCQVIMMANKEDAGQYVCQVGQSYKDSGDDDQGRLWARSLFLICWSGTFERCKK